MITKRQSATLGSLQKKKSHPIEYIDGSPSGTWADEEGGAEHRHKVGVPGSVFDRFPPR